MAAPIAELYGADYQDQANMAKINRLGDIIASNLAGLNFQMRYDFNPLFNGGRFCPEAIRQICDKVVKINPKMIVLPIKEEEKRMLPYTLNGPALYLRLIDVDRRKIYLVYISPQNMEAF